MACTRLGRRLPIIISAPAWPEIGYIIPTWYFLCFLLSSLFRNLEETLALLEGWLLSHVHVDSKSSLSKKKFRRLEQATIASLLAGTIIDVVCFKYSPFLLEVSKRISRLKTNILSPLITTHLDLPLYSRAPFVHLINSSLISVVVPGTLEKLMDGDIPPLSPLAGFPSLALSWCPAGPRTYTTTAFPTRKPWRFPISALREHSKPPCIHSEGLHTS
jgi:hypothetical protein